MKPCSKCKIEKPLDAFSYRSATKDNLSYNCISCEQIRRRAIHQKCKGDPIYTQNLREKGKRRRDDRRDKLRDLKMGRGCENSECTTCGPLQPHMLHWHHTDPESKLFKVSRVGHLNIDQAAIDAEVAKCIVLCAPCHRAHHSQ